MHATTEPSTSRAPIRPDPAAAFAALRSVALLRDVEDRVLRDLVEAGFVHAIDAPRDTILEIPPAFETTPNALCLVVSGQVSIGVFDVAVLAERGRRQRDATLGEKDGTLMPPGPLARTAKQNLAMFDCGELFNLSAVKLASGDDRIDAFSLGRVAAIVISGQALAWLAEMVPNVHQLLVRSLALTNARLRSVTGIKHEILDFYLRNGLSVAGPTVRVRQLDLCIDCKQCEEACEKRHGAQRLTLGGYELGVLDFVFTCRTCADARCLSPCEHDAIKRDAKTGEIQIVEDRCIGCSLCALSCPYGAIDMINVAEPGMPSYNHQFKARLEKKHKLGFGPGKGRKAPARRIANKCDHCAGYGDQACVSACPTGSLIEISPMTLFRERVEPGRQGRKLRVLPSQPFTEGINVRDSGAARVRTRKLSLLLWIVGLGAFFAVLAEVVLRWYLPTWSASYYVMHEIEGIEPEIAMMNVSYLAGTKLALACGYIGTALMVLSMAYLLQRRFGWFSKTATNQFWLDVHLMTGIVGPLFIVLHSALRLTTWVSIPFWSMVAVVISGVVGRYLYTLIPTLTSKHDLEILDHRRAITELAKHHAAAGDRAYEIMERENARSGQAWEIGLVSLLLWILFDDVRQVWIRRRQYRELRRLAPRKVARAISSRVSRVVFYERRKELAPRSQALLRSWKKIHIPFSMSLLITMVLHIVIALGIT